MLYLLTQNGRSAVNLKLAQNLSIIEKLGTYELVFFREGQQCCIIDTFRSEKEAKDFLCGLLELISLKCESIRGYITCRDIYNFKISKEYEGISSRNLQGN